MFKELISLPYQMAHSLRSSLYDIGILKRKSLDAFVVSVGNLSFGGTGKTPFTIELAKSIAADGAKLAILTRGYKAKKTSNKTIIVDKDSFANYSVEDIGDEAYMMAESFIDAALDIPVMVNSNRYQAGLDAINKYGANVLIMDDGRQHIQLKRDLEIILKNSRETGFFREFRFAEHEADFLVYSKVDDAWLKDNSNKFAIKYDLALSKSLDPAKEICAVAALADNQSFFDLLNAHLNDLGIMREGAISTISYPDHHFFALNEVNHLGECGKNIVCTAKDFVKIPDSYKAKFIRANLIIKPFPLDLFTRIKERVEYDGSRS